METQKIQATITLTLTPEQLLMLLNAQPPVPQPTPAPMPQQQTPAPQNLGQMFPAMPTAAPAPMPTMPQAQIPAAQPMQPPAPMPTAQPQTYSVQDLGLAARPLMENGRQQELIALLAEFGVPSVAQIPEDRRADFAARLRALGGQI